MSALKLICSIPTERIIKIQHQKNTKQQYIFQQLQSVFLNLNHIITTYPPPNIFKVDGCWGQVCSRRGHCGGGQIRSGDPGFGGYLKVGWVPIKNLSTLWQVVVVVVVAVAGDGGVGKGNEPNLTSACFSQWVGSEPPLLAVKWLHFGVKFMSSGLYHTIRIIRSLKLNVNC